MKFFIFLFMCLLLAACSSDSSAPNEEKVIPKDDAIRIYSDAIGWDKKSNCRIEYLGESYDAKIKFRGGVSSKYGKHSMTLELDGKLSFGGLAKNDDWILNASYIDKTFQRHKLSYDIFRLMHPDNKAPKCTYLPVYHNDKYIGLYVVMEKVNGSWLGFKKKNPQGARLFKDPFVFVEERLPNVQEPDNYYQQKFPKVATTDANHELDAFKQFLFESDDDTFLREIENRVGIRNLIDWHLLLLLTNNDDGIFKNFYLYRDKNASQLQFIPWDYDHSFGRDGNYELNLIEREVGWNKVILLRRLMDLPQSGYAERLKSRYESLRSDLFSEEKLLELIAANDALIRPHAEANAEVWPLDAEWYTDSNGYDAEMDILKQYIPLRLEQLDNFFTTLNYGEEE